MSSEERCHEREVRIAIVDDSDTLLEILRELLEEEGYRVLTCRAWDDAFARIKEARPQLLILDVRMPGAPDWALFEQIQADPELAEVPCLVCSAARDQLESRRSQLVEQGCQVLLKPFDLDELLERVRRGLEASGPGSSSD